MQATLNQALTDRRTWLRMGIAAGSSLLILTLLLNYVTGSHDAADRPQLLNLLGATSIVGIGAYLALHLCGILVRALRYQILLKAAGETAVPTLPHMMLVTGFRNMVVDMLPSRLGELGYVALLNRAYGIGVGACFSSLAVSTVFDFIALAILVGLLIIGLVLGGDMQGWLFGALIMASLIAAIGVLTLTRLVPWVTGMLERVSGDSGIRRWIGKLAELGRTVDDALVATREAGVVGRLLGLSMLVRALKYGSIYLLFMAVAGPSLPTISTIPGSSVLAGIIGAEIGASLPIPTLMSFGSYEAGGTLVFTLLGLDQAAGLIALLATHIWSQVIDYSLGALCLILVIFLMKRTKNQTVSRKISGSRWRLGAGIVAVGALLMGSALALAFQYRDIQKLGAFSAPPRGESTGVELPPGLAGLGAKGFIVWSSNRGGNHDIWQLRLETGETRQLTIHPHTETWPRLSPDGRQMLFARSREPWVSQRNSVAWDTYLLDLESGRETPIAEQASYGFWIDHDTVGYLSKGEQVLAHSLNGGKTREILTPGGASAVRDGAQITSPSYNPESDVLALTGRQSALGMNSGHWGTALWNRDSGELRQGYVGCQLYWAADRRSLYQVSHGGHMGNQFFSINPETLEATPLLDLPGEFSHEYWPNDDQRGEFLVFGASAGGHEHDTADYEIFLWRMGSPADEAVRLTFHTGNDNWPDVYTE